MSTRPTPETDALIDSMNDDYDVEFATLTTHARRLERERDEEREAREILTQDCERWVENAKLWKSRFDEVVKTLR